MILTLLPIFFLLLGAGGVLFIQRFRPSLGISWLAALLGALASWVCLLIYRWVSPGQWIIRDWLQVGDRPIDLIYGFDPIAWQFAFIVATILLTVMLTAPVRLGILKDPREWALDLSLTGAALIPVVAQNPLSLIFSWTVLDLIEIIFYLSITTENRLSRQAIMAFSSRLAGTLMVFWAFLSTQLSGSAVENFSEIAPQVGLLYLLAVGLRLGVFPVVVHFSTEMPVRRELGTLLRFTVPASSLVLLARLTGLVMPSSWAVFLSIISLLAVFYGVIRYLLSSSEITGRPFWLMALAGMAVVSVVRFQGEVVLAWSQVMMLMGTFLSLYSYRRSSYWWLLIIGFVGVTGLPFTPASSGWAGLVALPFNLLDFLFIAAHAGLLMGYLKHAFRQEPAEQNVENWMLAIYPIGFLLLVAVQWFLGIDNLTASFTAGIWWASIISVGVALAAIVVINRVFRDGIDIQIEDTATNRKWFGFNWIYNSLQYSFLSLQSLVTAITRILEGEGAILWAILLLLVFLSLIPFLGVQ